MSLLAHIGDSLWPFALPNPLPEFNGTKCTNCGSFTGCLVFEDPAGGYRCMDCPTVPSIASGINPAIREAAAEPKALEVKSPPSPSPQGEDWRGGATAAASRELDQLDRAKEGVWYI